MSALADRDLGRFTREVSALTNAPILGIAPQFLYADEVADPRQNAIAAKMAEVQRQKQELRALTRKDTKR